MYLLLRVIMTVVDTVEDVGAELILDAAKFRDWCFNGKPDLRGIASVRSIINDFREAPGGVMLLVAYI